jgi:hypothetical protein
VQQPIVVIVTILEASAALTTGLSRYGVHCKQINLSETKASRSCNAILLAATKMATNRAIPTIFINHSGKLGSG